MNTEIDKMLETRAKTHGNFVCNMALTYELFALWSSQTDSKGIDPKEAVILEAVHMIFAKLSRVACGDMRYEDHWVDIIGYSERVLEQLRENK